MGTALRIRVLLNMRLFGGFGRSADTQIKLFSSVQLPAPPCPPPPPVPSPPGRATTSRRQSRGPRNSVTARVPLPSLSTRRGAPPKARLKARLRDQPRTRLPARSATRANPSGPPPRSTTTASASSARRNTRKPWRSSSVSSRRTRIPSTSPRPPTTSDARSTCSRTTMAR